MTLPDPESATLCHYMLAWLDRHCVTNEQLNGFAADVVKYKAYFSEEEFSKLVEAGKTRREHLSRETPW